MPLQGTFLKDTVLRKCLAPNGVRTRHHLTTRRVLHHRTAMNRKAVEWTVIRRFFRVLALGCVPCWICRILCLVLNGCDQLPLSAGKTETPRIKPGAAGWTAWTLPLCHTAPLPASENIFLLLMQSALTPNKLRTAGSLKRHFSPHSSIFQQSDSNPGQLGAKRKRYRGAMLSSQILA